VEPVKICTEKVTTIHETLSTTLTWINPSHTPVVGPGDRCNVGVYNVGIALGSTPPILSFSFDAQIEYTYYNHGYTFMDYCYIVGGSTSLELPDNLCLCACSMTPTMEFSTGYDPDSIVTTPTTLTGTVNLSLTLTNLCIPTILSVCPTE